MTDTALNLQWLSLLDDVILKCIESDSNTESMAILNICIEGTDEKTIVISDRTFDNSCLI